MGPYQAPNNGVDFAPTLTQQDTEHLNLLSLFGYVLGGLTALGSSFGLIHFFMGAAIAFSKFPVDPKSPPPPAFVGWMFMALGAAVVLGGWIIGGFTIYAGRSIAARKNKTLVQIMAGINCLSMPFGTLWGVFVFAVLSRPAVVAAFDNKPPLQQ